MVTGSRNGELKYWDFNGMAADQKPFREFEPVEGYMVEALHFNTKGGKVLCCLSDRHARIFTREGGTKPDLITIRGDMYVRDLAHTKGHTAPLTDGGWHPHTLEWFFTSSVDGSVRIWDVNAAPFGMDQQTPCLHVLKTLDKRNVCCGGSVTGGVFPSKCAIETNAKMIAAGCSDGSIQIFMEKQRYMKPDRTLRTAAHTAEITGMAFSGNHLATRGASELKLWDIRALSDKKGAVKTWTEGVGLSTMKAGLAWHNDILVTATESQEGGDDQKKTGASNVVFFDVKTGAKIQSIPVGASVGPVYWPQHLNQIICGVKDGSYRMFYDPEKSRKGALCFVGRGVSSRRVADEAFHNPIIFQAGTKEGLKEMRMAQEGTLKAHQREERKQNQKTVAPAGPMQSGAIIGFGGRGAQVKPQTAYMISKIIKETEGNKMADVDTIQDGLRDAGKPNPAEGLITGAYKNSMPENILDYSGEINKVEDRITGVKVCRMCGKKICTCGFMDRERAADAREAKLSKKT
jgi:hypothetical protein